MPAITASPDVPWGSTGPPTSTGVGATPTGRRCPCSGSGRPAAGRRRSPRSPPRSSTRPCGWRRTPEAGARRSSLCCFHLAAPHLVMTATHPPSELGSKSHGSSPEPPWFGVLDVVDEVADDHGGVVPRARGRRRCPGTGCRSRRPARSSRSRRRRRSRCTGTVLLPLPSNEPNGIRNTAMIRGSPTL